MKSRFIRSIAIIMVVSLGLTAFASASATTYPYDTVSGKSVRVRKSANTVSTIIENISAGDTVTILGKSGNFYKVDYNDTVGYAMIEYIDGESEVPQTTAMPITAVTEYPYQTTTVARVKLRKSDSTDSTQLLVIPEGEIVTVYDVTSNGFAKVKYNYKYGYVMTEYIVLASIPTPTPIPTVTVNPEAIKYTDLEFGDSGSQVRALQEALSELGYYTYSIDSKFGSGTKQAVLTFQKRNGLTQTGTVNQEMQLLIFEGTPKNVKGYRKNINALPMVSDVTIESGNTGEVVEKMQTRLTELGYYSGEINGECDSDTVSAIKAFQKKMGITSDGVATSDVLTILYSAKALTAYDSDIATPTPTIAPPTDTVRYGDSGDDVTKIQTRLTELGYYTGSIDGKFGTSTLTALKAFQKKNGLSQDGVCGAQTRTVLFGINPIYAVATPTPSPVATVYLTKENCVTVSSGSRGSAVLNIQTRLTQLGYYTSRLDGVYLEDDIKAVRDFQKANGLKVDGIAGYETQSLLFSESAINGEEEATDITTTLRYGSAGDEVITLQNELISLGFLDGQADGKFGKLTKQAVVAFQKANNLVRDGVVGTNTIAALFSDDVISGTTTDTTASITLSKGSVSTAVTALQQKLINLGYLNGSADGIFGTKTALALAAFQKNNGLIVDSIAGKNTLSVINGSSAIGATGEEESTGGIDASKAPTLTSAPRASSVIYANWYNVVKSVVKQYPYATIYDFSTGISWQVHMFSFGAHADAEPLTPEDTAKMQQAFGGTTWTPKPVWVVLSNGQVYLASTHDTAHSVQHITTNNFAGHLCIHFPRTAAQVAAIGPYATSHQKAIDLAWTATLALAAKE